MTRDTWIVVLVKDFSIAKARLAAVLSPEARRRLAIDTASQALTAAVAVGPTLAICGSAEAAVVAGEHAAHVVLETNPSGQNQAGALGLEEVRRRGSGAALLVSSDLPLIDADSIRRLLDAAQRTEGDLVVAAPALGRAGTNALLLRPPADFELQFGDASLPRFAAEAKRRGRIFVVHEDPQLALDLDEPSDLDTLARLRATA
jgi:2-phospho-L-lactate guanylyltransferase